MIIIGLILLMTYQPVADAAGFASESEVLSEAVSEAFDDDQAVEDSAAHWVAMARFYEKNNLLTWEQNAGDISAARWLAMARFFERHGLLTR